MAKNIELKLKVHALQAIETIARSIANDPQPKILMQTDIYYRVPTGRLKLRLINGKSAELIAYQRADEKTARTSTYFIQQIGNTRLCDQRLAQQFGRRTIVQKKRLVYFYQNTRIHLDEVLGLGSYVEFEYVVAPDFPVENGVKVLDFLIEKLGMHAAEVCQGSYVDLMEAAAITKY